MNQTLNINSHRKFIRNSNEVNPDGDYVLYWMQMNSRFHYNYALDFAVAYANKLEKPLLILNGLNLDYPWACDRFHMFMMQGMQENLETAKQYGVNFYSFVEREENQAKGLFYSLAERSALVISDEYPVFVNREHNERVADRIDVPYITIDSNGIIPLGITEKDPYSAYLFRKTMQKHFKEAYLNPPKENPLDELENKSVIEFDAEFEARYPRADELYSDIEGFVSGLPIDHSVGVIEWKGTRKYALNKLADFNRSIVYDYGEDRNHPDFEKTSQLSAWLHYGKISEYEIVKSVFDKQPANWSLDDLTPNGGKNMDFFNGNDSVQGFLDEVITWREVGFHFAHHRADYDQFDSLPDWAIKTMRDHEADEREFIYTLEEFEFSKTHDEIWNAAMTQLRETGIIHNYLRMLWGKKVIEWTEDHRTALDYLIELNNKYSIDGRDPNSYSGIFWCFGRFDRAWQERPVFGKLRFMSSDSTRKKVKLNGYLSKYGRQKRLL